MFILTSNVAPEALKAIRLRDVQTFSTAAGYVYAELPDGHETLAVYAEDERADEILKKLLKAVSNPLRRLWPLYILPDY